MRESKEPKRYSQNEGIQGTKEIYNIRDSQNRGIQKRNTQSKEILKQEFLKLMDR